MLRYCSLDVKQSIKSTCASVYINLPYNACYRGLSFKECVNKNKDKKKYLKND